MPLFRSSQPRTTDQKQVAAQLFFGGIYSINQPLESFEMSWRVKLTPVLRPPGLSRVEGLVVSGSGFFGKMCLDQNLGIALLWLGIGLPRLLLKSLASVGNTSLSNPKSQDVTKPERFEVCLFFRV